MKFVKVDNKIYDLDDYILKSLKDNNKTYHILNDKESQEYMNKLNLESLRYDKLNIIKRIY